MKRNTGTREPEVVSVMLIDGDEVKAGSPSPCSDRDGGAEEETGKREEI